MDGTYTLYLKDGKVCQFSSYGVTSYVYDAASHLISLTYPDGTVVEQTYDNVGRVTSVNGYAEYLWNETQLQQITYANGVTTTYIYDVRGRPAQIHAQKNGSNLLNLTYAYDAEGNILQMKNTENVNGQQIVKEQWDYTYDQLNRLRTAVGNTCSFTYTYDSTGNRTQLNDTPYSYNEMNELISAGGEGGTSTFEYDEHGNCIQKSDGTKTWEYVYDSENRLTAVKVNGVVTEEYVYDGDGNRIKKTDSSSERIYIYSGMNVLYEVNTTTQMDAVYIYGPTGRIAKRVNDIQEYYHTDHLGSTRLVTTENGVKTEEIQYQPFGEEINTSEERYAYNGKGRDETGLYYYGARYYDSAIGRFLTRDPLPGDLLSPQSLNPYIYCLNNPLRYTDPSGMVTVDETVSEFVILPDGTYSKELSMLYSMLQQALNSMTKEEWATIETLLQGDNTKKMEAISIILVKAGLVKPGTDPSSLTLKFGSMTFGFAFVDFDSKTWGSVTTSSGGQNATICIANHITKAGDLFLTLGHELVHACVIGCHGDILTSLERRYGEELKDVYVELASYEWESTMLSKVKERANVSDAIKVKIRYQHRIYSTWWYDPR